jgi:hypothetical protein
MENEMIDGDILEIFTEICNKVNYKESLRAHPYYTRGGEL